MIIALITAEIFDAQLLGRLLGVILTAGGIAEAVAPWIVGRVRDITGSYSNGFVFLIAISLLGSAVAAFLPKRAVRA
jgi:cyanate permease